MPNPMLQVSAPFTYLVCSDVTKSLDSDWLTPKVNRGQYANEGESRDVSESLAADWLKTGHVVVGSHRSFVKILSRGRLGARSLLTTNRDYQ